MTDRHQFAIEVAKNAGAILREGYHKQKTIHLKSARELVTEFDLRSEEFIIQRIQQRFPKDGFLAEEGGEVHGVEGQWVIDPLDGTTNFAHGIPFFVISIAYVSGGVTQLGAVFDPMREECFHASLGTGAQLGDLQIQVSKTKVVKDSLLATGFSHDNEENPNKALNQYLLASTRARAIRRLGSAALHLAYVAAGRLDGYWEMGLSPWDWAAGMLLVQEAGGRISRIDDGEEVHRKPTSMLASNNLIHDELQQIFQPKE